jgi:membrane protease YdiL (CAAX protease family)
MGLAQGYIRDRSGSLYPGMVMHFCHNLFVVLNASGGPT